MKKRLIAMVLVLCMVFSFIPVYASATPFAELALSEEITVTLDPGEGKFYTVPVQADTRYYSYLQEADSLGNIYEVEIRPENGTTSYLHGTSYDYTGYKGNMFTCGSEGVIDVYVVNHSDVTRTVNTAVVPVTSGVTSMTLEYMGPALVAGGEAHLRAKFEPAFTYDDSLSFSSSNPGVVGFDEYIAGTALLGNAEGSATITATWANGSATYNVDVTWPNAQTLSTTAPQTVTVPANERTTHFFKFTAPADADTANYVVYTEARDDLMLTPLGFAADNFQSGNYELVILSGLIPNQEYYLKLECHGAQAGNVTVTMEKSITPTAMALNGFTDHFVGTSFYMNVEFPTPAEYTPVVWNVADPSVASIDVFSNYAATFMPNNVGTTTVTASIPNTTISESIQVVVSDPNNPPSLPPSSGSSLTLGQLESITLNPGETVTYTYDANPDIRYYYYICPAQGSSDFTSLEDIHIDPRGTNKNGSGMSYHYSGHSVGTVFVNEEADTTRIMLTNNGEASVSFQLGVAILAPGAQSMGIMGPVNIDLTVNDTTPIVPQFAPAFAFDEFTVTVDEENIVDIREDLVGVQVEGLAEGQVVLTFASKETPTLTASCTINVSLPANNNTLDITTNPQSITVPADEMSTYYFKFTAPQDVAGNYYVVHTDAREDVELTPVGFGTDNFQSRDYELVLYDGDQLIAGEEYYLKLVCHGAQSGNIGVTFEKCEEPTSLTIIGKNHLSVDEIFSVEAEFPEPKHYRPVTWSVDNAEVVRIDGTSNYGANFVAIKEGTTTITAMVAGMQLSGSFDIEVTEGAEEPPHDEPVYGGELMLNMLSGATLNQGDAVEFTFTGDPQTKYYYHIVPAANAADPTDLSALQPINIEVRGTNEGGDFMGYNYNGHSFGTVFVNHAADTTRVILRNHGGNPVSFRVGVQKIITGITSMESSQPEELEMTLGDVMTLQPLFMPLYTYDEEVDVVVEEEGVVSITRALMGFNVEAVGTGTTTITMTAKDISGNDLTATCEVTVKLPQNVESLDNGTVTVDYDAYENEVYYFSFTAPDDIADKYYVISCPTRENIDLEAMLFGAEQYKSPDHSVIVFTDLIPGDTYYVRLNSMGPEVGDRLEISMEACTAPQEFPILGNNCPELGDYFVLEAGFANPSEFVPVDWSIVQDEPVLRLEDSGSFCAGFTAQNEGTATVVATIRGTNITAEYEIIVGQMSTCNVVFYGEGGTFNLVAGEESTGSMYSFELEIPAGITLREAGLTDITDISYFNPDRQPLGWKAFVGDFVQDEDGNWALENEVALSDNVLTKNGVLDTEVPEDKILVFRLQWDRPESDFVYDVFFEAFGGQITYTEDGSTEESVSQRGQTIRKGQFATLADALNIRITNVTTEDQSIGQFQQWLMFQENADGKLALVSDTPISFADLITQAAPNKNTVFVAKWSNISLQVYLDTFDETQTSPPGPGPNDPNNVPTYPINLHATQYVQTDPNGLVKLVFTAPETGLYMMGWNADGPGVIVEDVSPAAASTYDHDIIYNGDYFCGPVYQLTKDVTYTFTMHIDGPEQMFYVYQNVEATDISAFETEVTGYVGSYVELYYSVEPYDSFSGVNTSTSSDPSVADDAGGANYDCSRVIGLYKEGTANITITLANGKSVTIKVNAVEPPVLTLGTSATKKLDVMEIAAWKFTATQSGIYYFTADCETGECSIGLGNDDQFFGGFYSDTASGIWLELQAGEEAFVSVANPDNIAQTFTVTADIAPKATSISLDDWETYPMLSLVGIPTFEPLGAYDEVTGWTVSDPTVLEIVDTYGNEAEFEALKPGTATVTVTTAGGLTGTATYTVKEPLKLDAPEQVALEVNEFKQLVFEAPEDGLYFTWKPANDNVDIQVSANDDSTWTEKYSGYWTSMTKGEYLFIDLWNMGNEPATTTVTVTDASKPITAITLEQLPLVYMGLPCFIDIIPTPLGAIDFDELIIADESVLEVVGGSQYSLVLEPKKVGTTTVTVTTLGGVSASCTVTVVDPAAITLDQGVDVALEAGERIGYKFTAPEDGEYIISSTGIFTYEVNDGMRGAYFGDCQPYVQLKKGDSVLLFVFAENAASSGTVTVQKITDDATDITMPNISGVVGYSGQHTISLVPAGSYLDAEMDWNVTDPTVAKIVGAGYNGVVLEYLKAGTATLKLNLVDYRSGETVATFTAPITITEPIVVPEDTSTPTTVTPEAVDSALDSAISDATPGETVEVVIKAEEAAADAGTTVTKVEVPVASVEKVADADAVLTVELSGATVTMDSKTLETLAEEANGATITLSVEHVETTELTEKQQKALENKKVGAVLTAQILSDGQYIGDFKGGNVTISIPFTPPEGKNGNSFAVYYVADDGTMERMKTSFENGILSFTTKHFSDYVAVDESSTGGTGGEPTTPSEPTTPTTPSEPTTPTTPAEPTTPTTPAAPTTPAEPTTPSTTPVTPPASNPATGDSFMLVPVMALFVVSALVVLVLMKKRKA